MTDFKKVKNKEGEFKKEDETRNAALSSQAKEEETQDFPEKLPYLNRLSTLLGSQLSMYGILAL